VETLTADKTDSDDQSVTDSTTANGHAPVRQVISVNGEEEDVENINIHDFTTFEQEQLIGSEFIGGLKRKSINGDGDSEEKTRNLQRNRLSFRSAVRAVLTTETIMQAMKHYNHRSDSETEEDEDDIRSPLPTETEPLQSGAEGHPETLHTEGCVFQNLDLPTSLTCSHNVEEANGRHDKRCESDTAVNLADGLSSVDQPDTSTSLPSGSSVTKDGEVELSAMHLVDTESVSPTSTATDAKREVATLSSLASAVVNGASPSEMRAKAGSMPLSEATNDVAESKAHSQSQEATVTTAITDSDDADTAKMTDRLMTSTAECRPTETADAGCQCCSVQ